MNGMKSDLPMAETDGAPTPRATTLLRGNDTGRRLAIVELLEVRGREPPRHLHINEDEVIYVLEGMLSVWVDEKAHHATPGTCLFLPRGTEHGYAVESGSARLLIVLAPAGLEEFLVETTMSQNPAGVEQMIAVAARYGIALTGPAPTNEDQMHDHPGGPAGTGPPTTSLERR